MIINNPLPASCSFLLAGLPGVWLLGWLVAKKITEDRRVAHFLSPGLGMAAWLLAVHFGARWSGSFRIGLWIGTASLAPIGMVGWVYEMWQCPIARSEKASGGAPVSLGLPHMIVSALLTTVMITPMALRWAFHDEQIFTGHTGIVAQIQNDHYPPHHMTFPEFEYRYHYGFDLAAAAVTAVLRVSPGVAIDILTLLSWSYTWCLLWVIGDELLGRGRGWVTAVMTMLGGGVPYLLALHDGYYVARFLMVCEVGGMDLNPPMISYFFQHPWALGLPFALCTTLILLERHRVSLFRYGSLAILLSALSISQVVVFASLAGAIPVAEVFSDRTVLRRRIPAVCAAVIIAMTVGWAAGGFFLPPPERTGLGIGVQLGVSDTLRNTVIWHLLTYGLLLPLGVSGLFFLRKGHLLLALLTAGSLFVINVFFYSHSWDIVKFGTVAALALSIASSATVSRIFSLRPALLGRGLGILLLAGVTADGLAFPIIFVLGDKGIPEALYTKEPSALPSKDDVEAINWLRTRVLPGESVYRKPGAAIAYDTLGGLPVPWFDAMTVTFGFSRQRLLRRGMLLALPSQDPSAYIVERIRWFVLGPGDATLNQYTDEWVNRDLASVEARFGGLRIVRLKAPVAE